MEAQFDNATIKVWFNSLGASRNFTNVTSIIREGNSVMVTTADGKYHILNMANINMLEQID